MQVCRGSMSMTIRYKQSSCDHKYHLDLASSLNKVTAASKSMWSAHDHHHYLYQHPIFVRNAFRLIFITLDIQVSTHFVDD